MLKRIVEKNGKYYLVKGLIQITWWDEGLNHWWWLYPENATGFSSKEELRDAYKRRKPKFVEWL